LRTGSSVDRASVFGTEGRGEECQWHSARPEAWIAIATKLRRARRIRQRRISVGRVRIRTLTVKAVHAPVAQRIRASVFGTEGRGFESLPVYQAPVAQLDRALVSGTKGRRFESCRVYQEKYQALPSRQGFIFLLDKSSQDSNRSAKYRFDNLKLSQMLASRKLEEYILILLPGVPMKESIQRTGFFFGGMRYACENRRGSVFKPHSLGARSEHEARSALTLPAIYRDAPTALPLRLADS
jgi:hypothetical protein